MDWRRGLPIGPDVRDGSLWVNVEGGEEPWAGVGDVVQEERPRSSALQEPWGPPPHREGGHRIGDVLKRLPGRAGNQG